MVLIIYDCTVASSMPKWISINGLDGAINSQLQWSNQVSQSNQMPNLCNYYSFLITCDMFTCLHFICNDWQNQNAMSIRQYTTYVMGNDWCPMTAGDGDLVIAPLPSFVCCLPSACLLPSRWLPWHCLVPSWSTNILPLSSRSHCCLQHDIGRILIDCAFDVFCAYWFYFMIIKQF